jgi:hypothetical protein
MEALSKAAEWDLILVFSEVVGVGSSGQLLGFFLAPKH